MRDKSRLKGNTHNMSNRKLLALAVVVLVVGVAGVIVTLAVFGNAASPLGTGSFSSDGQRIYYTGIGVDGRVIPRSGSGTWMMGRGMPRSVSCVNCHGQDGRGGTIGMMFSGIKVPDIRYSVLSSAHTEDGESMPGWTDSQIGRAIRDGFEPDGERLKAPMPRWRMTDAEVEDVIGYLKELDAR